MPEYVIEREIPNACELSAREKKSFASTPGSEDFRQAESRPYAPLLAPLRRKAESTRV